MTIRNDNPARPIKVAIIGGGPGGLAMAIALDKVPNLEVVLYEKSAVLREVGAGISIGQNTWNVLELLGVAASLTSGHPTLAVLNLNGRTGEELTRVERQNKGRHTSIRTERTHLQAALLKHVKPGVIHYGKKLERIEDLRGAGVRMYFVDGSSDTADLVIEADEFALLFATVPGLSTLSNSQVRPYGELFSLAVNSKLWIHALMSQAGGISQLLMYGSRPWEQV
jgi:salicylate hydroxylase